MTITKYLDIFTKLFSRISQKVFRSNLGNGYTYQRPYYTLLSAVLTRRTPERAGQMCYDLDDLRHRQ